MYFTREAQVAHEEVQASRNGGVHSSTAEQTIDYESRIFDNAFNGDPGGSSRNHAKSLLRSPALSYKSNTGIRAIALSRAQRTHGNRYTQQLISQIQLSSKRSRTIQRECACGGTCTTCTASAESMPSLTSLTEQPRFIQAATSGSSATAGSGPGDRELIPQGNGQPLDEMTRRNMEERFGADFGDVRIHADPASAASAAGFGANAYTTGRDIYFAAGKYAPTSQEGEHLLAHELTHVQQQTAGQGPSQSETTANGEILIGAADDHLEREAETQADSVTQGQPAATTVTPESSGAIQRDLIDNPYVNRIASGIGKGVDLIGSGAKKGKELVVETAKKGVAWALGQIEKLAPGAIKFFRNIRDYFKNAISNGVDSLFGGILSSIREKGLAATLAEMVGSFAAGAIHAIGGFIVGNCAAMGKLAEYLIDVVTQFGSGVLDSIKKGFDTISNKLDELWKEYGAPALEWVTKKLKGIWKEIEDTATWIWDALKPLRDDVTEIWNAVTDFLAEGRRSYNSWMEGFVNAALDKWEEVKAKIKPYMGYVKTAAKIVGGVVLLFSPAGPFVVLGLVIYGLYLGVKYLWDKWGKGFTKSIREWWANDGLPTAQNKLKDFRTKVDDVKKKVMGGLQDVYDVFMQILGALGVLTFLATVKGIFDSVTKKVQEFKKQLDKQLDEWSKKIQTLLTKADPYLQQMKEVFRQTLLIGLFGPYAIFDDGVWSTVQTLVGLVMKTPCLREIAGLFRVPGIVQWIGTVRTNMKAMWKVIQNPDPLLEEIKKAIEPMIAKIEPTVHDRVFNRSAAPAAPNAAGISSLSKAPAAVKTPTTPPPVRTPEQIAQEEEARKDQERRRQAAQVAESGLVSEREAYISLSIWHYLVGSLAELAQNWWPQLKKMAGDLIWPWPEVEKDFSPMLDNFGDAVSLVFDLEFSKAIDKFLKGMKLFNGIAGALSGWFLLASVLIGAALGALGFVTGPGGIATVGAGAAAGLEVAEAVGMGLLAIAAATELSVMEKADFDLKYQNMRIPDEQQRNQADQEDCKDIAGSLISLVTIGALVLLADIAAKFAKFLYSLVEDIPIVKDISALLKDVKKTVSDISLTDKPGGPVDVVPEGGLGPRGEPLKAGEPTKAGEPEGRVSDDAAANAEKQGVPREKLEVEVKELNQKASNPKNVREPADPRFDAEMDAEGHTFDRSKSEKTWCRASDGPSCGLDLGGDLNAKVDKALKEKSTEAAKPGEEAPVTETKPTEVAEPVDPKRAQLESDLADATAKKKTAEAKANEQRKTAEGHRARAKELDRQLAIAKGEARAKLREQLREANAAADQASKAADAAFKEATDAQLDIQKKTAQLNTDKQSKLPCFAAGTLVLTPSGTCAIDKLKPHELVMAYDFVSGLTVPREVLEVHKNKTMRFHQIAVGGATILSTSLHRFWSKSADDWVEARNLRAGMELRSLSGASVAIDGIEVHEEPYADTFNLHIEKSFTYFVGNGVLVHNAGGPSYSFGNLRIYAGTNPNFPGKVYIGQTDDIARRQGEHRAEAIEKLKDPSLTKEQREFWEFKKDMVLEQRVSGLNPDQANYLEQQNMNLERDAGRDLMNRREQVRRKNMTDLEKKIASDPAVKEAGLCP